MADKIDKAYGQISMHKDCKTWADRQKDFQFFTPGLLYWNMNDVDRDIIEDWVAMYSVPVNERPKKFVSPYPIFSVSPEKADLKTPRGWETYDISKTIYICPKESWDRLDSFLTTTAFENPETQKFSVVHRQSDLIIPDYGAIKSGAPQVEDIVVAAYCLSTTEFFSVWRQSKKSSLVYSTPKACLLTPSEITIKDGIVFFEGKE